MQIAIILFSLLNTSLKMAKKRPKHVGGLTQVCILLYLIVVQLLGYTGHTQKNGAVLIMFTIKTAPLF
jgi:hypothetical protein